MVGKTAACLLRRVGMLGKGVATVRKVVRATFRIVATILKVGLSFLWISAPFRRVGASGRKVRTRLATIMLYLQATSRRQKTIAGSNWRNIMARQKRKSASVAFAENRANALKSIDPALDLGNGLTLADYQTKAAALKTKNDKYNTDLSTLDGDLNSIQADEKTLDDLSGRMLAGVGSKYGKDSDEYEKAGGTRTSERKPPTRKNKAPATPAP